MDTHQEVAILVHLVNGRVLMFLEVGAGLYIWKLENNCNLLNKQFPLTLSEKYLWIEGKGINSLE